VVPPRRRGRTLRDYADTKKALEYTLEHAHEATFSQPKDYELWWEAREEECWPSAEPRRRTWTRQAKTPRRSNPVVELIADLGLLMVAVAEETRKRWLEATEKVAWLELR